MNNMTETQTNSSNSNEVDERIFSTTARRMVAGGLIGGTLVAGAVVDSIHRGNIADDIREKASQEQEHEQAVLNEINEKSTVVLTPGDLDTVEVIDVIPQIGESDLYGEAISLIPSEFEDDGFVTYTVTESSRAQGIYQPDDSFVLVSEEIDGRDTLIVQKFDNPSA